MHTRLRDMASDVVSVRNLAGLGENEVSDGELGSRFCDVPTIANLTAHSQASFPRSVTLPQLPSPRVAFLGTSHLVY